MTINAEFSPAFSNAFAIGLCQLATRYSMTTNDPRLPKAWEFTVTTNSIFGGANKITIPGIAKFTQISNYGSTAVSVRLNGDSAATFTLHAGISQIFNPGDMEVSTIDFAEAAGVSGGTNCPVQVICGVCNG
jgi:hypothetical protein